MLANRLPRCPGRVRGQDSADHDDLRRAQRRGPAAGPGGGSARPARQHRRPAGGAGRGRPFPRATSTRRHGPHGGTPSPRGSTPTRQAVRPTGWPPGHGRSCSAARRRPAGDRAVRAAARGTVVPDWLAVATDALTARSGQRLASLLRYLAEGAPLAGGPAVPGELRVRAQILRARLLMRAGQPQPATELVGLASQADGRQEAEVLAARSVLARLWPPGAGAARNWPGFRRPGPGGVEGRALPRRGRRDVLRGETRHRAAAEHAGHRACPDRRTACSGGPARRA